MRRIITRTLLPAASAVLVLAGGTLNATAQHADHGIQIDRSALLEHHPELDRDGDGKLNDEEIRRAHALMQDAAADALTEMDLRILDRTQVLKRFPKADRDSDGTLDDDELRRAIIPIIRLHMSRAAGTHVRHNEKLAGIDRAEVLKSHPEVDANGDGEISNEELHTAFARMHGSATASDKMHSADDLRLIDRAALLDLYPSADSDGDGALSDKEVHMQVVKLIGRNDSNGPAHGDMNLHDIIREEVLERHPEIDADGDGVLSGREIHMQVLKLLQRNDSSGPAHGGINLRDIVRAEVLKRHPEVDADGDGKISEEELHEFISHMHGGQGGHDKK